MVRGRLFVKIYLTLLACLAAVALASGLYWRLAIDSDAAGWLERRDRFVQEILPPADDPAETRETLQRLGRALNADISVYGPDGRLIAATGTPLPLPDSEKAGRGPHRGGPQTMRLPDGRIIVAELQLPWQGRSGAAPGYLLLIALVVGAAAYPVVRHLTRRLEALRDGVEKLGSGALGTRVPVRGRDEVAAVAASFNATAEHIERLVGSHRRLLANASHELRSPLTRLRMAIDLYGPPSSERQAREIVGNLDEIDHLVDEILLASRLDDVDALVKREPLDFTALLAEECARHGIEVSGEHARVVGDARLLARLVRNLLANATRHGRPPIEVELYRKGAVALLGVRDHGDGLPIGEEERIFEPFYRPTGRLEAAGGWGLGLALVKQIAELHGGRVRYERPDGAGARFLVELPRSLGAD